MYDAVQKLVEESQQEIGQQKNLLGEVPSVAESLQSIPNNPDQTEVWQLSEIIQNKLLLKMKVCRAQPVLIYSGQYTYSFFPPLSLPPPLNLPLPLCCSLHSSLPLSLH